MDNPLLSVCIITYNHSGYIRKAIESVLMQKVIFPMDIIIADDCSTDGTREIIIEYKKKYPDLIKLILQGKNVGAAQNWFDLITSPRSKYVAYFEGDDYWIDPLKLQKQVDILEQNPDLSSCFHNALVLNEDIQIKPYYFNRTVLNPVITIGDVINCWMIPTASLVFLREHFNSIPEWFPKVHSGDYAMELILSSKGNIGYLDEVMSVYRQNPGNLSAHYNNLKVVQSHISMFNNFNEFTEFKYNDQIALKIKQLNKNLKVALLNHKYPLFKKVKQVIKKMMRK